MGTMPIARRFFLLPTIVTASCCAAFASDKDALFQVKSGDKWGFINSRGDMAVSAQFDVVSHSGTVAVCARGPEGWVELHIRQGRVTKTSIECDSDAHMVRRLGNGMYGVLKEDYTPALYDPTGRFKAEYDEDTLVQPFGEGLLPLKIKGSYGFVDRTGRMVIEPRYDLTGVFHEGLASVKVGEGWGAIDRSARMVVAPRHFLLGHFVQGMAVVSDGTSFWYIDRHGTAAFDRRFRVANTFACGRARVIGFETEGLSGYIDLSGEYAIPPRFATAKDFSEGLAAVTLANRQGDEDLAGVAGYIDRKGEMVGRVEEAKRRCSFKRGLALVRTSKWMGYIDRRGELVWKTDEPWTPPIAQQVQTALGGPALDLVSK